MGGTTDIKVRIKKCTNLEGNSMLPGWSSDPYVIVKLCEKKEELEKFQTKTVSNCANPEFDESHRARAGFRATVSARASGRTALYLCR